VSGGVMGKTQGNVEQDACLIAFSEAHCSSGNLWTFKEMEAPGIIVVEFYIDEAMSATAFSRGKDGTDRHVQGIPIEATCGIEIRGSECDVVKAAPRHLLVNGSGLMYGHKDTFLFWK
jgi:hypothetical protein